MTPTERLRELIASERARDLDPARRAQNWQRIHSTLASGAPPIPPVPATPELGALGAKTLLWKGLTGALVAVGVGSVWTGVEVASSRTSVEVRVPAAVASVPAAEAVARPPASATTAAAPMLRDVGRGQEPRVIRPRVAVALGGPQSAAVPPPASEASPHQGLSFDAELRLIREATQAIDAGRPDVAQVVLAEHEERFPRGHFALERSGLRALANCELGAASALPAAREYIARHPRAPLVDRLRSSCGLSRERNDRE